MSLPRPSRWGIIHDAHSEAVPSDTLWRALTTIPRVDGAVTRFRPTARKAVHARFNPQTSGIANGRLGSRSAYRRGPTLCTQLLSEPALLCRHVPDHPGQDHENCTADCAASNAADITFYGLTSESAD